MKTLVASILLLLLAVFIGLDPDVSSNIEAIKDVE